MENGPFTDDFPIKTSIYEGFSMAMLNNQMVRPLLVRHQENHRWTIVRKSIEFDDLPSYNMLDFLHLLREF